MALQQVSAELAQGQQVRNRCILLLVVNFTMFPFNDVEVLNKMGYICYVCLKDRRPALYIYALKAWTSSLNPECYAFIALIHNIH